MNLIGDPWIPVALEDGCSARVGLRELYERAHEIRDLALNPVQRISVMRLLLCITHAALDGPEDEEDWRSCGEKVVPESLRYLHQREDKFQLFGPQPFLQVGELRAADKKRLDKLDFGLAAGHNPTVFDQQASADGREHDAAWVALRLLTYQCFSPGGTIGNAQWAGSNTGPNSEHAPCVESSPLLTLIRGPDLLSTVHLNLIRKEMISTWPFGRPVWDLPPDGRTTKLAKTIASSFLGRLVPLSRAIRLFENSKGFILANGISYPKFPAVRESMATVIVRGQGKNEKRAYLNIELQKHPWRELGAVLSAHHMDDKGGALALAHLPDNAEREFDLWVGGLVVDRGKLVDTAEWVFNVPSGLLGASCLALYTSGVHAANRGEQALRQAVKEYCQKLQLEPHGFTRKARAYYWSILDNRYGELISIASQESALDTWRGQLISAMREGYSVACPHTTARQVQAFAVGRRRLYLRDSQKKGDSL